MTLIEKEDRFEVHLALSVLVIVCMAVGAGIVLLASRVVCQIR